MSQGQKGPHNHNWHKTCNFFFLKWHKTKKGANVLMRLGEVVPNKKILLNNDKQ